jgi:hypothetical protein
LLTAPLQNNPTQETVMNDTSTTLTLNKNPASDVPFSASKSPIQLNQEDLQFINKTLSDMKEGIHHAQTNITLGLEALKQVILFDSMFVD